MQDMSAHSRAAVQAIAARHGFGVDATLSMLDALVRGRGAMAQFSHPEFGGSGQWMRGGMSMVSDMFNTQLAARVDALCTDLSSIVDSELGERGTTSFQSQTQHVTRPGARTPRSSTAWWPSGLGSPTSTGDQDGMRYAYFAEARRLAIDVAGTVTLYDTLDHRISGFSQQQPGSGSMSFHDQHGPIALASLPVVRQP